MQYSIYIFCIRNFVGGVDSFPTLGAAINSHCALWKGAVVNEFLLPFLFGVLLFILGILLLKRHRRLFSNAVITTAKVVDYRVGRSEHNSAMYTMEVEYALADGTLMRAFEQQSSNRKRYKENDTLDIFYSQEKPELFFVCGGVSRTVLFYGMMAVGLLLMGLFGYFLFGGQMV